MAKEPKVKKEFKSEIFVIENTENVSFKSLCDSLAMAVTNSTPWPSRIPLAIDVKYQLNAPTWRVDARIKSGWHLRLPAADSVLNASCAVLKVSGYCTAGQVVGATVLKYPLGDAPNILKVSVTPLDGVCREDNPTFEHRVLIGYLQAMERIGRVPTRKHYFRLLAKLKAKNNLTHEQSVMDTELKNELVQTLVGELPPNWK